MATLAVALVGQRPGQLAQQRPGGGVEDRPARQRFEVRASGVAHLVEGGLGTVPVVKHRIAHALTVPAQPTTPSQPIPDPWPAQPVKTQRV